MLQVNSTSRFCRRVWLPVESGGRYCNYIAALLTLLCGLSVACAEEPEKRYPPYPDVWGYELPMPGKDDSRSHLDPTKLPNGEYAFTYVKSRIKGANDEKTTYKHQFALMHFFSGAQQDITGDELDRFWADHNRVWDYRKSSGIRFSDGTLLKDSLASTSCPELWNYHLRIEDGQGNIIRDVVLFILYDEPRKWHVNPLCERNWDYDKNYVMRSVDYLVGRLLPLDDDTFLLYSFEENIIIRLDKDLNSKSDLLNRKLFFLDLKKVLDIYVALSKHDEQTVNDAFTRYFTTLNKETRK